MLAGCPRRTAACPFRVEDEGSSGGQRYEDLTDHAGAFRRHDGDVRQIVEEREEVGPRPSIRHGGRTSAARQDGHGGPEKTLFLAGPCPCDRREATRSECICLSPSSRTLRRGRTEEAPLAGGHSAGTVALPLWHVRAARANPALQLLFQCGAKVTHIPRRNC